MNLGTPRLIMVLSVLLLSQLAHAKDVTITLSAEGTAQLVSVFGVPAGSAVGVSGTIVVDDTSTDRQVIPAGTFMPGLGAALTNDVLLLGRAAIKSLQLTAGSASFGVPNLVDFYWTALPHVIAIDGNQLTSGAHSVQFQMQDFSVGDIFWGGFNCNSDTGVTVCSFTSDGAMTDYLTGGYALFSSASATFADADGGTLWYNGDGDPSWFGGGLHSNIEWTVFDNSEVVYEDFVVDHPDGWTVTRVWSNNVTNSRLPIDAARWSIREGMVPGEAQSGGGGRVIAEGISPATQVLSQRIDDPFGVALEEYTIEVSGLDVRLPPGTYWVSVAPVITEVDQSLPSDTLGLAVNAVGIAGGTDNAHVHLQDWEYAGQDEFLLSSRFSSLDGPPNYSLGVGGHLGGGIPVTRPPVIDSLVSGTLGNNGWYTSDVSLSWQVDSVIPITGTTGCNARTIKGNTAGVTYTCTATNAEGTSSKSVTIQKDATAPTARATAKPGQNAAGWRKSAVTVTFVGSDRVSGIASCSPPVLLASEGVDQGASGTCINNAGLTSDIASASGIDIDLTLPSVEVSTPSEGAVYVRNSTVNADYSCSDALSGIASCTGPVVSGASINTSKKVTNKAFVVTGKDAAGNITKTTVLYSVL